MQALSPVPDKVSALALRFTTAGIPHAFGGEVAWAAHVRPQPPSRIDLHVFLPVREAPAVLARLAVLGLAMPRAEIETQLVRTRCAEWRWGPTPLALRFGVDGLHALAQPRIRRVPFGERFVYVLSAEDLVLAAALRPSGVPLHDLVSGVGCELDLRYVARSLDALGASGPPPELAGLIHARSESPAAGPLP